MERYGWLAVGLGVILASPASGAEDTYTIKIKEPDKGEVLQVEATEHMASQSKVLGPDGKALIDRSDKSERVFSFRETILEKEPARHSPTRLERRYDKAQVKDDNGAKHDLPFQGKSVLIEKKDKRFHFRIDGGEELKPEEAGLLHEEFNKDPDEEFNLQKAFLPAKAVALNETWNLNLPPLLATYSKATKMQFDEAKSQGTGKLVKVYEKDGARFGVLQLHVELPIKELGDDKKKQAAEPGAKWVMDLTLDGCIDGTRADGSRKTTTEVHVTSLQATPTGQQLKQTLSFTDTSLEESKEVKK
jgi:hypothetical protein